MVCQCVVCMSVDECGLLVYMCLCVVCRWMMCQVTDNVSQGDGGIDYLLGIAPTGLVIYRNKTKIISHFWSVLALSVSAVVKLFI